MEVTPKALAKEAEKLKNRTPEALLLDIVCIDLGPRPLRLIYRFLDMNTHTRPTLCVDVGEGETVGTVSSLWKNAAPHEMEIHDLFGVAFSRDYPRQFTKGAGEGFPLRKNFVPSKWMGGKGKGEKVQEGRRRWYPRFPEDKGAMLFELEMQGEVIRRAFVVAGYFHRGIEKRAEEVNYSEVISLFERPDDVASLTTSLGLARAVEEFFGMDIPPRAQALRMVFFEYARIYAHLFSLSQLMIHFGLSSLNRPFFGWRRTMGKLINSYRKEEASVAKLGGALEVGMGWVTQCFSVLDTIRDYLGLIEGICTRNDDWISRPDHFHLDPSFVLQWGIRAWDSGWQD